MLSVENLKVVYRGVILALDGVSLEVGEGEAVALLGPNGAGKSSLVRAIAGLLPKFEGRVLDGKVRLFGREATHLDPVGISQMGLTAILEGRPLFRYLTPVENLMAAGHRLPRQALKEGMEQVVARFPRRYGRRQEPAGYRSGGEQQMLLLGMALLTRPRLLVVDEPSLGLAPKLVGEVMQTLEALRREKGLSLLLVEQNARAALGVVDRVYVLERGRVVFEGSAKEAMEDQDVMEFYLGKEEVGFRQARRYRRRKRWV